MTIHFEKTDLKKYFAEMLGTAVLVFFAVGTAIFGESQLVAALAFGLVIIAMAYTIGSVSGCHINPAVTLGLWLAGRVKNQDAVLYVIAQFVGAMLGGLILFFIALGFAGGNGQGAMALMRNGINYHEGLVMSYTYLPSVLPGLAGTYIPGINIAGGIFMGLMIEIVLTFVFVFVILMITSHSSKHEKSAGFVIGLTLTLVHLVGIPLTGTSVNPARSWGAAIFGGGVAMRQVWLFLLAPLAGAALAALAAKYFLSDNKEAVPAEGIEDETTADEAAEAVSADGDEE